MGGRIRFRPVRSGADDVMDYRFAAEHSDLRLLENRNHPRHRLNLESERRSQTGAGRFLCQGRLTQGHREMQRLFSSLVSIAAWRCQFGWACALFAVRRDSWQTKADTRCVIEVNDAG
jgi:hypothetical protein